MATAHWRTGYSVAQLFSQPDANWSFHQLVRLLLGTEINDKAVLDELERKVEFVGTQSQNLPPGEIRQVEMAEDSATAITNRIPYATSFTTQSSSKQKHKVECAHYNLTGLDGPLAEPFLDVLREDERFGAGAMAAFVNIFNNRIHALRYLIHAETNHTLTNGKAADNFIGEFLLALSGHYYSSQRDFHGQSDDALLALSGHLANCRMTLPTVRKLFLTVMELPVIEMNSVIGRWLKVQKQDHTCLGSANHRLGGEATLGKRVWDQQAVFELVLGPVDLQRRSELLPGGSDHQQLRDLVAWISEKRCDCKITLVCQPDEVVKNNATKLSRKLNLTNRLGYGTALDSRHPKLSHISFMLNLVH